MIKGEKYNLRKSWVNFCQQKYIFWVDKGICLKDTQKKGLQFVKDIFCLIKSFTEFNPNLFILIISSVIV